MPSARRHDTFSEYLDAIASRKQKRCWADADSYTISLLKAWWGDAATESNDFCFNHLPRITGDHSIYPTIMDMRDGQVEGFFGRGENPAFG